MSYGNESFDQISRSNSIPRGGLSKKNGKRSNASSVTGRVSNGLKSRLETLQEIYMQDPRNPGASPGKMSRAQTLRKSPTTKSQRLDDDERSSRGGANLVSNVNYESEHHTTS